MNPEPITLQVGDLQTNCYLVSDDQNNCVIIDPGDEGDFISTTIIENKLKPLAILLTHGHYDHCLACLDLKLNFNLPIYLHKADEIIYQQAHKSALFWKNKSRHCEFRLADWRDEPKQSPTLKLPPIDFFLTDQKILTFGNLSLQVLHTPGHTPGSCCFTTTPRSLGEVGWLFTGDTLFKHGVGRTDLPYSSPSALKKSLQYLRSTIHDLPNPPQIFPGHEEFGFSVLDTVLY